MFKSNEAKSFYIFVILPFDFSLLKVALYIELDIFKIKLTNNSL